jgi:hypothetical protein
VKIYPAQLFAGMPPFLRYLIAVGMFLELAGTLPLHAGASGFLEGHLKIISMRGAELAGETPAKGAAGNYGDYPLIILSRDEKKEVARVIANENGNYRVALPPGDYMLDVYGRSTDDMRATPQPFTVTSNQTVHLNMNIETDIR